jgi:hypothetical protein
MTSVASAIDTSSSTREDIGPNETLNETAFLTEPCPFSNCKVRCRRTQELGRHICEHHLPYHIYCERPGCNWTGNRRYALKNHLANKHASARVRMPGLEVYTIYDAKELVKQLLSKEISVEQAMGEARSLFRKKAVELGKLRIWKATCVPTSLWA